MTAELVREVADQIVREQLLLNWKLYALVLGLAAVGSAAGTWLSSYTKKRGETYASKADMQEILLQVAATTRATEEVRVAVSFSDWANKEWQTIRRTKLEAILETVYSLDHWLEDQQSKWLYKEGGAYLRDPLDKISYLGSLYFPELRSEVSAVVSTHRAAFSAILDSAHKASESRQDTEKYQASLSEHVAKWRTVYPAARQSVAALEARCGVLMHEIAGA